MLENLNVSARLLAGLMKMSMPPRRAAMRLISAVCLMSLTLLWQARVKAAEVPSGFADAPVVVGLSSPTAMAFAPDGRLFVCLQGGQLRVIKNGALLPTPFISLTVDSYSERGLLGIAFDPNFSTNRYLYLYYTATSPSVHNRVSRFTASGDVVVPGSEVKLFELNNLSSAGNHNGGAMHFGPDGKLYIAVGENNNPSNAQTLGNLLGKVLRINRDGTIPSDNPFYDTATGANRAIWALGLRNPFTFAFHPSTGRMFINDVGQDTWEEVNEGTPGANFGWPTTEGPTSDSRFNGPVYAYKHSNFTPSGCAITGGTFYSPVARQFPSDYEGVYFFADYCGGWIWKLDPSNNNAVTAFATGISAPVDLQIGPEGALYYLARGAGGAVRKIEYTANDFPQIVAQPSDQTVVAGQRATFSVSASGAQPLSYQWQKNGANISGATASSYTTPPATVADSGALFSVIVSNSFGNVVSNSASLIVTANNRPTASILTPAVNALYIAGDTINYSGSATDPEDGMLASGAFTWQVDFHHDTHSHPFIAPTSGKKSGSFVIPTSGETSANVWYRISLTVRDSAGLTHTVYRDIFPQKVNIMLATSPTGLQVTLDGQPQSTPTTLTGVVGVIRSLGVVSPQTVNGVTYVFDSWSDGGAATHSVSTPDTNTTYTAVFRVNAGRVGNGEGLTATYYDNQNFTGTAVTRVDPVVNFEWRNVGPAAGIGADTFSARWIGRVQPQFSETYRFYTRSDDGMRLWVNGQLLINNWTDHGQTENSGSITLVAGQKYDVRMEYYDNTRTGIAKLLWSSPSTPQAIIPRSQLYATTSPPAPWLARDIGSVTLAGDAGYANGTFTIKGAGADIWENADAFHFAYRPMSGDGEIVARVASIENTYAWAKAGVMMRESLNADSRHAMVVVTPEKGVAFQRRLATGSSSRSTSVAGVNAPHWVKLVRRGNVFSGYHSSDGSNWTLINSETINMSSAVHVGLPVASHNNSAVNTATLDSVVFRQGGNP